MLTIRSPNVAASNIPGLCLGNSTRRFIKISGADHSRPSTTTTNLKSRTCQFLGSHQRRQILVVRSGGAPGPSVPSDANPGSWKLWIVGVIFSVVIPFCRNKWLPLLMLKDKVESAVETAEQIAEIVEKVAEGVEHVAEEVAEHLPEDAKIKEAVTFVEHVADQTAKGAHVADEVIEKVEEVEKQVETFIDQGMDHADGIIEEAKDKD